MTIHAFCRRLLAAHPLAAGLDPRFRVLDAAEATRLADRAANEALDELLAAGDADVAAAAAAYQPWRMVAMTVGAHARLRSQGMSRPRLPEVSGPVHSPTAKEEQRPLNQTELAAAARARAALERLLERFGDRYDELKEERSALDFQDLELRALALLRDSPSLRGLARSLLAPDGRRVPGHQQRPARVDRAARRPRDAGAAWSATRTSRSTDSATPTSRCSAASAGGRTSRPTATCCRCAATSARFRRCSPASTRSGARSSTASPSSPPAAVDGGPGSVELLLTLDEGRGKEARRWAQEEIDLEPPPGGSPPRVVAEARCLAQRLRGLVDGGEAQRGDIVVLLRAFTHVDAYEEALRRAGLRPLRGRRTRLLDPAAGRGPDPAARRRSRTRSTTSVCSERSPASRTRSAPTPSGCCAAPPATPMATRGRYGR